MSLPPIDWSTFNGPLDWIFHSFDSQLFGAVGVMMIFLIVALFAALMFMNANKFTVFGFMGSLLLAMGYYGYSIIGWIAPLAAVLMGLILGIGFILAFRI